MDSDKIASQKILEKQVYTLEYLINKAYNLLYGEQKNKDQNVKRILLDAKEHFAETKKNIEELLGGK